ncbi:uncharacterized protein [Rutidosis leptorrhynchoides]|uniref:uncharacterized protein n=1 Tax=Rutidosis leptorrhynchoides TaxID=125765 RepID=UPI003A9A5BB6
MEIQNPAAAAAQNLHSNSKKRNASDFQESNYFKMRALVKDLRPHFLEVLRTPDFKTSKAASEINQQMKVLMKLYEDMTSGTITMDKCKTEADSSHDQKKPIDLKPTETPLEKEQIFIRKPSEERHVPTEKQEVSVGSYVVGGSAFGWNFITYSTSVLAAYYGRTKEDFRAANPIQPKPLSEET